MLRRFKPLIVFGLVPAAAIGVSGAAVTAAHAAHAAPVRQVHVVQQAKRASCPQPDYNCIYSHTGESGPGVDIADVFSPSGVGSNWIPTNGVNEYAASGINHTGHDLWEHHNSGGSSFCVNPGDSWADNGRPAEWQTTVHTTCGNDSNPGGW